MNVDEKLKALEPPAGWTVDSASALRKLHTVAGLPSKRGFWYRALAAAAVLTAMLLLPVARSGAEWLWRILHVDRISVVGIPYELPPRVVRALTAKLLSPAGTPTIVANRAEAERQIGFPMRLPRAGTLSSQPRFVVVIPGPVYEQRLDRAKIQSALESLHRLDLVMPSAPDGARIRIGLSAGAAALYGHCEGFDCEVTLSEAAAPEIAVSGGVDLGAWIGFSLQLAGVSASDALRYTTAMKTVLPVTLLASPASGVLNEATVDGVPAVLFQSRTADGTPRNSVVWLSKGRLYSLIVRGSANFALTVANSLE